MIGMRVKMASAAGAFHDLHPEMVQHHVVVLTVKFGQAAPDLRLQLGDGRTEIWQVGGPQLQAAYGAGYGIHVAAICRGTESGRLEHRCATADKRIQHLQAGEVRTSIV
jgi:hypothetical protein